MPVDRPNAPRDRLKQLKDDIQAVPPELRASTTTLVLLAATAATGGARMRENIAVRVERYVAFGTGVGLLLLLLGLVVLIRSRHPHKSARSPPFAASPLARLA